MIGHAQHVQLLLERADGDDVEIERWRYFRKRGYRLRSCRFMQCSPCVWTGRAVYGQVMIALERFDGFVSVLPEMPVGAQRYILLREYDRAR